MKENENFLTITALGSLPHPLHPAYVRCRAANTR